MLRQALTRGANQLIISQGFLSSQTAPIAVLGSRVLSSLVQPSTTSNGLNGFPFSSGHMHFSTSQDLRKPQAGDVIDVDAGAKEKTFAKGFIAPHAGLKADQKSTEYMLMNPVYTPEYVESVKPRHRPVAKIHEKIGYHSVRGARWFFDKVTGYSPNANEAVLLQRMLFLETVAGVPGMVAGMLRHMRSLRTMQRDNGWIHTLLEEAENERMHLLTFMQLRQPGILFRGAVLLAQGVFFNAYLACYILSPKTCHSFVGYLEEEAVKTYTHAIDSLKEGKLPAWSNLRAPEIAINYWKLPSDAMFKDVLLAVRADEACHSHVNHTFSAMQKEQQNPFVPGSHLVD